MPSSDSEPSAGSASDLLTAWLTGSRFRWLTVLVVFTGLHLFLATRGWESQRLIGNEYRQTHTAITAYFIKQDHDFSLAYPTPLLGAPWSVPYEFPLYQWMVAWVSDATGWQVAQAARLVSLLSFYALLPALVWLVRRFTGSDAVARLTVLLAMVCPLYIFYARAFLIDVMALAATLWYARSLVECLERPRMRWFIMANLFGLAAGLVKIMTLILFSLPLGVYFLGVLRQAARQGGWRSVGQMVGRWAATAVVPIVASYAWIQFADSVKRLNPSAAWLTSEKMNGYHFGTLADRVDPKMWSMIWHTITTNLAPIPVLALTAVALLWPARAGRWRLAALLALFAAGPLIYPQLYYIHEYYFTAVGVFLAAALALALVRLGGALRWRWIGPVLVLVAVGLQLETYRRYLYPHQRAVLSDDYGLAGLLRAATDPDDILIVVGDDWAPMLPYGARRRALMFRTGTERDPVMVEELLTGVEGEKVGAFVMRGKDPYYDRVLNLAMWRFGLHAEPVLTARDYTVWADAAHRRRMLKATQEQFYAEVQLTPDGVKGYEQLQQMVRPVRDLLPPVQALLAEALPMVREVKSQFPMTVAALPEGDVISAHPHQLIWLDPPSAAIHFEAEFGIVTPAYEDVPLADATDGVDFSLWSESPEGQRSLLWRRELRPAHEEKDRGTQSVELDVIVPSGHRLLMSTGPGRNGALNRDWAYWKRATLTPKEE